MRKRTLAKHLITHWLIPTALLGVIFGGVVTLHQQLRIEQLACTLDDRPCPTEIVSQLQQTMPQPLLFSDPTPAIQNAIGNEGLLLVSFQKQLPNLLTVRLQSKQVFYQIKILDHPDGTKYLIDDQRHILSNKTTQSNQPEVEISQQDWQLVVDNVEQPTEVSEQFDSAIKAVLPVSEKWQTPVRWAPTIITMQKDNRNVLIDPDNADGSSEKLLLLWEQFDWSSVNSDIIEVDLRYKYPVLRETRTLDR